MNKTNKIITSMRTTKGTTKRTIKGIVLYGLIIILMLQIFTVDTLAINPFTSEQVYEGLQNGQVLLQNIKFTDIQNHWAQEPIQEVAALSLMKGNNAQFRPNGTLTYAEALTTLVRVIGKEEEAQKFAEQQLPPQIKDFIFLTVVENWAVGYIQVAIDAGILTQEERNQILNLTARQLADLEYQTSERLKDYYSGGKYTQAETAQIRAQIRDRLLNNSTWHKPVSRQQMAAWIARALEINPSYGENIVKVTNFTDWQQIDTEKLPLIETLLQKEYIKGMSPTIFSPRGTLTRAQLAQLMANINDELLNKRGLIKKTGTIYDIETVGQQGVDKNMLIIENDDNSKNIIYIIPSQNKNFILQKDKKLSLSSSLKKGDRLEYYINSKDQVVYAKSIKYNIKQIKGFIDYIDITNHRLIVTDYKDKRHLLQAKSSTPIKINGQEAMFKDLFNGQEVKISLIEEQIKSIEEISIEEISIEEILETDPSLDGYIEPGSRTKVGKVLYINRDTIEITINDKTEKYRITSDTQILRNGGKANLFEIKEGDKALLRFDDIYTTETASIQVEDNEKHITALYKGTLDYVNEKGREIVLDQISIYQNGKWNSHSSQKIKLKAEENLLYLGANTISLKDLENHQGKEVYVAAENSYGLEKVAKLLLKEGSLIAYEDKISKIQYGNSQIVVDNNLFTFHPGTIVVKNNRLIDALNLEEDQNIYLAGSISKGTRKAAIIDIQYDGMLDDRIDGTKLVIYRGRLEDIQDYGITIGRLSHYLDYLKLNNKDWTTISKATNLTLTEDSYILDSDIKQEIDVDYLIKSRYINPNDIKDPILRNRIINDYYINKSAYIVAKETRTDNQVFQEVLLLNLTPDLPDYSGMVNIDHSAIGEIEDINIDTSELTIKNIKHWNTLNNKWESAGIQEQINLDKAVILLNDKPIRKEEFYLIKEKSKAYIIKSKTVSTSDHAYIVIIEQ